MDMAFGIMIGAVALVLLLVAVFLGLGIVVIGDSEVGIVSKKFSTKSLPPSRIIALNGEAGYQADTLSPGWHFGYWFWQYAVEKVDIVVVPAGTIALVSAIDGAAIQTNRILAKSVLCDNFQDARKFLNNGGEKGRQVAILTAGSYRINTALFQVITYGAAQKAGADPNSLKVYQVPSDKVGIVTALDGAPVEEGEIAGPIVKGHNNFQEPEAFMAAGGKRGLQEQVLLSGSWNLNPWFSSVELVAMTEIPIGHVGVVISYVGAAAEDVSGAAFKHGDLVEAGHKGVWATPLPPGKHPLNTKVLKVELIPTTNIVLNWANQSAAHKLDDKLSSITVRSKDGYSFNLDVSQIIHVAAKNAPKVILRIGSMKNLVDHVLEPTIGNYFRNSSQSHTALDFLWGRTERQKDATTHIKAAIEAYDVDAIDTLIGDISTPPELMKTQTDRMLAAEQEKTFKVEEATQKQRQLLIREHANADIQTEMVRAEQSVRIAEMAANVQIKKAEGDAKAVKLAAEAEAERINKIGTATADAYKAGVQAMGSNGYVAIQVMRMIGDHNVKVTPDTLISGGNGDGLILNALMGTLLKEKVEAKKA